MVAKRRHDVGMGTGSGEPLDSGDVAVAGGIQERAEGIAISFLASGEGPVEVINAIVDATGSVPAAIGAALRHWRPSGQGDLVATCAHVVDMIDGAFPHLAFRPDDTWRKIFTEGPVGASVIAGLVSAMKPRFSSGAKVVMCSVFSLRSTRARAVIISQT